MQVSARLHERARSPTPSELADMPWLAVLDDEERRRMSAVLAVANAFLGDQVCRAGRPPTCCFGVVDGLLKMSNDGSNGAHITYTGIPPGAWFGDGTLLKREN